MLLFLYRLFVVGFPPKCKHNFKSWNVIKTSFNDYGDMKIFQSRQCGDCGWHEFKKDNV